MAPRVNDTPRYSNDHGLLCLDGPGVLKVLICSPRQYRAPCGRFYSERLSAFRRSKKGFSLRAEGSLSLLGHT